VLKQFVVLVKNDLKACVDFISVNTGIEQMSTLFENSISGESMGSLIQEPGGCGEQNMYRMTLPVIATLYLDKTNQWEDVGFDKRNKALGHIKSGKIVQMSLYTQIL